MSLNTNSNASASSACFASVRLLSIVGTTISLRGDCSHAHRTASIPDSSSSLESNRSTSGRNRPTSRNAVARSLASASLNTPSFVSITDRKLRRRRVWFSPRTTLTDGSRASPLGGLVPAATRRSPFRVTRHQFLSRIAPETPCAWRPTGRRRAEREPQRLGEDRALPDGSPPALGQRTRPARGRRQAAQRCCHERFRTDPREAAARCGGGPRSSARRKRSLAPPCTPRPCPRPRTAATIAERLAQPNGR